MVCTGISICQACLKVGIKYSTGRDIMSWYRKHGRPYRSDFDQERMRNEKEDKIEVSKGQEP